MFMGAALKGARSAEAIHVDIIYTQDSGGGRS